MPGYDTQPVDQGASDDQLHDPITRADTGTHAKTAQHDAPAGTSQYNLGQTHSSRTQSVEERVLERMSEEQIQRFMQNVRDVIAPHLLHTIDAVRTTLDTTAGLRSMTATLAEFFSTAALIRDAWSHQLLNVIAPALRDLPSKIMRAAGPPTGRTSPTRNSRP